MMMAELLLEETVEESATADTPESRLEKFLRESSAKTFTAADFDFPKNETLLTEIRAEVEEFLQMREEWSENDRKLSEEREKSWQ